MFILYRACVGRSWSYVVANVSAVAAWGARLHNASPLHGVKSYCLRGFRRSAWSPVCELPVCVGPPNVTLSMSHRSAVTAPPRLVSGPIAG